jgi:hypothetical protein
MCAAAHQVKEVVVPGTTLFVLNPSNRTVLGIFEAASPVGYNLGTHARTHARVGMAMWQCVAYGSVSDACVVVCCVC